MNEQEFVFWFALFSDLTESTLINIEEIEKSLPGIDSFYKMGDVRLLLSGKLAPFPNKETSINFPKQQFFNIDIEYASIEWIRYWEAYIDSIQLIREKYNFRLSLCCEIITGGNFPALTFPLDFMRFLVHNNIEFCIDMWE